MAQTPHNRGVEQRGGDDVFVHTMGLLVGPPLCSTPALTISNQDPKKNAEQMKIHTMFVIGKRDMEASAVSVRVHGQGNLGAKPRDEVVQDLLRSIRERRRA